MILSLSRIVPFLLFVLTATCVTSLPILIPNFHFSFRPNFFSRHPSHPPLALLSNSRGSAPLPTFHSLKRRRHPLADDDEDDTQVSGLSVQDLRSQITDHRLQLTRLQQEQKDLAHEKSFLEKTLELKKGQKTMQDGQVKLSQAELADKTKEIAMYRREAPRTLDRYNDLVRKQRALHETLTKLHRETEQLVSSKAVMLDKINNLNVEDLVERHARGLPDAMAGALRKSAAALTPFFDYLVIAADTNNRLVDHVGAEIDRYTHVNISSSPFMSGILFYCVLLIPLLTLVSFIRRIFDTSSRLTVTHYIVLGNLYFIVMCFLNIIAAQIMPDSPVSFLFHRYERPFIVSNLFLAMYYVWHVAMLALQAGLTMERRNVAQLVATATVGLHYYLFTWRRIFTDTPPIMYTFNYLIYSTIFAFVLHERMARMSSRQISEFGVFRFLQVILFPPRDKDGDGGPLKTIQRTTREAWAALFSEGTHPGKSGAGMGPPNVTTRRGTRRKYDHKTNGERAPRRHSPERLSSGSEDGGRRVRTSGRKGRGFFSLFFGAREERRDSSSDDDVPAAKPRERERRETRPVYASLWKW